MWRPLLLLSVLLVSASLQKISALSRRREARSTNAEKDFVKWPSNKIPIAFDTGYSEDEIEDIWTAISKVSSDLDNCVQFVETELTDTQYKILVTKNGADGVTKEPRCASYPGIYEPFRKAGKKYQRVTIVDGPGGCMGKGDHFIMKYFAIILGKVNEHKRPDRDNFIQMNVTNMAPGAPKFYAIHPTVKSLCPYDYCSITHDAQEAFAKPGTDLFTVKNAPFFIPKLDSLSECDCKELRTLYGCDPAKCEPLNCTDPDGYEASDSESDDSDSSDAPPELPSEVSL